MTRAIDQALIAADRATAATYQAEIHASLNDLRALLPDLELLTDTRQLGTGFSTPASRDAMDRMIRAERTARRSHPVRRDPTGRPIVGLKWLNGTEATYVAGEHATPGNFRGIATLAEVAFALTGHIHRIRRVTLASGHPDPEPARSTTTRTAIAAAPRPAGFIGPMPAVTTIVAADERPHVNELADRLDQLVDAAPSPTLLAPVERDLADLVDQVSTVVDGPNRSHRPDPCPHCGHHTLIRYEATRTRTQPLIRCERDPRWKAGHYRPCVCSSAICQCKTDPVAYRHEWFDNPKDKTQRHVWELIDRIKLIKENTVLETKAQDATRRVRDLHQRVVIHAWADNCPGDEHLPLDPHEADETGTTPDEVAHQVIVHAHGDTPEGRVCLTCPPALIACTHCTDLARDTYVPYPCTTLNALDDQEPH